jgi:hypothetical protein
MEELNHEAAKSTKRFWNRDALRALRGFVVFLPFCF